MRTLMANISYFIHLNVPLRAGAAAAAAPAARVCSACTPTRHAMATAPATSSLVAMDTPPGAAPARGVPRTGLPVRLVLLMPPAPRALHAKNENKKKKKNEREKDEGLKMIVVLYTFTVCSRPRR